MEKMVSASVLTLPCRVEGSRTNALLVRLDRSGRLRREDTFEGSVGNDSHQLFDKRYSS